MRVFLDANILFSGALSNSRMADLLEVLFEKAECLSSEYAINEARRNIQGKHPDRLEAFESLVSRCEETTRTTAVPFVELHEKDVPILGAAVGSEATHLLTGDERHFGKYWGKVVLDVKIVSPRLLAEELGLL